MTAPGLVEHFFRHEYGRLVAALSRRVGVQNIEAVEDAVQSALMTAPPSLGPGGIVICARVIFSAVDCRSNWS